MIEYNYGGFMIYTNIDFKNDFILNIDDEDIKEALKASELEFIDSGSFSNRTWNTYSRKIYVYCHEEDYKILNNNKKYLYDIADKVHHIKDEYMLTGIEIIKRAFNNIENPNEVVISDIIKFNKMDDCIGEGGFARVYKYSCPLLKETFAFKVLDPSSFNNAPYEINVERFIKEAKTLLKFNHQNIVKFYNIGRVLPNSYYIKMEWIDGVKLKEFINEKGPIDIDTYIYISKQILSAVSYSHSFNILHRDLTERNIMITDDNTVKILDFGLAKDYKNGTDLTTLSNVINTDNMAPEIKESIDNYSIKSDIYAIGCIMFRILTNKAIHPNFLDDLIDIDDHIKDIIKKCIATDLDKRYDRCEDIYADLEGYNLDNKKNDKKKFSLKYFDYIVSSSVSQIEVPSNFDNSMDRYRYFVEECIVNVANSYRFKNSVTADQLFDDFGLLNISYYSRYHLSVPYLFDLINFYNNLNEDEKLDFLSKIKSIIDPKLVREKDD